MNPSGTGDPMITLPGDITSEKAGPLLRRGAPVRNRSWRDERADVTTGDPYPYTDLETTELVCATAEDPGGVSLTLLALDLSDDLGMDIAARWLARHHGLTVGATAPGWLRSGITSEWMIECNYRHKGQRAESAMERRFFADAPGPSWDQRMAIHYLIRVPGISALTDPAAALRLAILAAAGRLPAKE